MSSFYVSSKMEFVMAAGLTIAATQHLFIYLGLLLVAALILPSARMGDRLSFAADGAVPVQRWLIFITLPLSIVIATLDYYEIFASIEKMFAYGSILTLSSAPLKGLLFAFIVSKTFIYSLLRAKYALTGLNELLLFHILMSIGGVIVIWPAMLTLNASGHNYGYEIYLAFVNVLTTLIGFGFLSSVVSFFFSIGRR